MKKLALTSLIAMFAFTGAHAANVIDGNPLYMPKAGHFYSVTAVGSHTEGTPYSIGEEFGYGVTDKLAVEVSTSATENDAFETFIWSDLSFNTTFRALDMNGFKLDLLGAYKAGTISLGNMGDGFLYSHIKGMDDTWFEKESVNYAWSAGVRGGYVTSGWTIAGHVMFNYLGDESFNWADEGLHTLNLGLDAQYVIDSHWSVLAGAEYTGLLDSDEYDNAGSWTGSFGVNYNIDTTKFVGLYINGSLNHQDGDNYDEWGWDDGFGFGAKFGIDF
ncbi:MAG: hypothetical protein MJ165_04130 [Alphaproteobacteria bacterium]|nr:hypothetical protein [Alphaproteobacteria bacterium]